MAIFPQPQMASQLQIATQLQMPSNGFVACSFKWLHVTASNGYTALHGYKASNGY